jgi:hypothetical protein
MILSKNQASFGITLSRPGLVKLMEPRGKSLAIMGAARGIGEEYDNMLELNKYRASAEGIGHRPLKIC